MDRKTDPMDRASEEVDVILERGPFDLKVLRRSGNFKVPKTAHATSHRTDRRTEDECIRVFC